MVRRTVPFVIAVFLAVLGAMAWMQSQEARVHALNAAMADMELLAAPVAAGIDLQVAHAVEGEAGGLAVPGRALSGGRRILITNSDGEVVAAFPPNAETRGRLIDHLGSAQPLTTFSEKAGAMRIDLGSGEDAIAQVHSLASPLGQVAFVHPVSAVLGEWRAQTARIAIAFISTAAVIAMLTAAFLWQANRAGAAETGCDRVRDRIDTALSRGRCGLWDWDIARGRIYWSSSMYEVLGMEERAEFMSFGEVNALMHPDDGDLARLAELLAASQSNSIDHVFRLKGAGGDWVWLRARAELVRQIAGEGAHLVGIAVDVTEQKRLAEKNATADARLREALETVSEALVLWDADNRLVMCNSKFQLLHGLPGECVRAGLTYANVMANATPLDVQSRVSLADRPQSGARSYEVRLNDGRWLQINERRTRDGGYVSVGTDITQLKTHEVQLMDSEHRLIATVADLRRTKQMLEFQAQQLADMMEIAEERKAAAECANLAKSHFLANMSHELRTPLNAIIGFAEMMQQEVFGALGSSKYVDYCGHIQEGGRYLLAVIGDVLDMSSIEAGRIRLACDEFEVGAAVAAVLQAIRPLSAAKAIELVEEASPGARLSGDRASLEKILTTLLHNAVKFTPEGGKVTVRTRKVGGAINLYVEDNGIGMSAEAVRGLGRPFVQPGPILQNGMKGSGLGLAIARGLVDLHQGSMRIRSTPGAGTIVQVHLPAPAKRSFARTPLQIAV